MAENNNEKYEEFYKNYLQEQRHTHGQNQKKIRVGLKVNIFLPLVFLFLSFLTHSSKLIFLILWIVSLFGIAFYLMYVEFTDHKMQKRLQEIESMEEGTDALIGESLAEAGERASAIITERAENAEARMMERVPKRKSAAGIQRGLGHLFQSIGSSIGNTFRVFWSDARRLSTNVVAVVVIIGLSVIPCLYAWFNILSNWAPYEAEATGNLMVAVATTDAGTSIEGKELNVGTQIVDNLKGNNSINWIFVDTEDDAVNGVNSGKYYAALVVSEHFSEDLVSFIGGNVTHPSIAYYENEKKNAIAPKITGKVKTTVQSEVNKAFVSTLAGTVLEASRYVTADGTENLTDAATLHLQNLDRDLSTVITILDSYISIMDTTESLMTAANQVSDEMDILMQSADTIVDGANASVNATKTTIDTTSDVISVKMQELDVSLVAMDQTVQRYASSTGNEGAKMNTTLDSIPSMTPEQLETVVSQINDAIDDSILLTDAQKEDLKSKVADVSDATKADINTMNSDMDALKAATEKTNADADELYAKLTSDINTCRAQLKNLSDVYQNQVKPQLKNSVSSVENSIDEVKGLLNYSKSSLSDITAILGTYPNVMELGREHLVSSREDVAKMQAKLRTLIKDMDGLSQNERYAMVMKLLKTDPELISDFISEPIELSEQPLYAIDTNGSATAPFYIVLSIWVGALILVAIVKTEVKNKDIKGFASHQKFFGRYVTFFLIGQLQTVITVLGALLYVKIQCQHPFLFWLAMAFTSLTFTFFLYSLTYAFGAVGEAIAVVLMVLQVAGSGGTFPIEVLPSIYQVLYRFMPFAYSMNAARECIAGMYQWNYVHDILALCCYIAISVVIGLVVSIPCKKLNHMIEASKEGSELMV